MRDPQPSDEVRISDSTVRRLSGYYRILEELDREGEATISSFGLAKRAGVTPAQVRKDLSLFGHFGKRGTGYTVHALRMEIRGILGLDRRWPVCLVGAGNLAHALYAYKRFAEEGFEIRAVFDNDPDKIGQAWNGLSVRDVRGMTDWVRESGVEIGIITTPAASAQEVANQLVAGGVRGILNFAPNKISVPGDVHLRNVNLAVEMESLSFALK